MSDQNTIDGLKSLFENPGPQFRSMPLWNWNTKVTRQSIDFDLQSFQSQGFGGVFIHPRRGFVQEYLGDQYMELWRYAMERAKKLGLSVWIYDENTYPAGFAGGLVQERMPQSYNQPQGLSMTVSRGRPDDRADFDICLKMQDGQFVEAAKPSDSNTDYYLFKKTHQPRIPKYNGFSWVDLLVEGVTETFIDITMKPHETIAGDEFGVAVPGIFSDEPHIGPPHGSVRYWSGLFEAFQKRWGYDLKVNLPCLFERIGAWQQVRHNYFQVLLEVYIQRWSMPYQAYCRRKGLLWTGHYWEHTWPNLDLSIDDMALYEWHDIPGIDMLFNNFDDMHTDAQFGNIRAVKEAASVANQMGRKRVLCETYGGAGWDLTFEQMKRFGDWTFVLGVNFMNQHLSYVSLAGTTKYDHPPAFSHQEPWWPYYKVLNDYYARLAAALSSGQELNDILVIHPNTTIWMYVKSGLVDALAGPQKSVSFAENDLLNERAIAFQEFVTELSRAQIEYDLGSEAVIRSQGRVDGKAFVVGQRAYHTVVIAPGAENLNQATFDLLRTYIDNGGKVLLYGHPDRLDGKINAAVGELLNLKKANVIETDSVNNPHLQRDDFWISDLKGGYVLHQRRRLKDGWLIYLANASLSESAAGKVSIGGCDAAVMDLFTGQMSGYPHISEDGNVECRFCLAPAGSLLLYISESLIEGVKFNPPVKADRPVRWQSPITCQRERDNVLVLNYCDLTVEGKTYRNQYVLNANTQAFQAHGLAAGNPWRAIQFKNNIVAKDTFGPQTGFEATYSFIVDEAFDLSGIRAVVEKPHLWTVMINGQTVKAIGGQSWLDRSFGVYTIGDFIKPGKNALSVSISPMSIHAEIEPIYIIGDFNVAQSESDWVIVPPKALGLGSWRKQGMPFYSDAVIYGRGFNIDKPAKNYIVCLPSWCGTVTEIMVNGVSAGVIFHKPYQIDVSGLIRQGSNRIEVKVVGSRYNTLGPFFTDTQGIAGPNKWEAAPDAARPQDYRLMDYGLFDEIMLLEG